ncbi:MAG TPA: hypothetical protein GX707_03235 [Epulopiscium sp.]|nr:hypothetical protein [Candidatus Epulonipiscium sp.]
MKYKKVVLIVLTIMLVGTNSFAYANEMNQKSNQNETTQEALAELYHRAGLDNPQIIINSLGRLGISQEELQEYVGKGKKIYDILQEKQVTPAKFKKALTKEYKCSIKEAEKNKVITKEEAKTLMELLKEKMCKWEI